MQQTDEPTSETAQNGGATNTASSTTGPAALEHDRRAGFRARVLPRNYTLTANIDGIEYEVNGTNDNGIRFQIIDSINGPYEFRLQVFANKDLPKAKAIGQNVWLEIVETRPAGVEDDDSKGSVTYGGVVTDFLHLGVTSEPGSIRQSEIFEYVVRPTLLAKSAAPKSAVYKNMNALEIVRKLYKDAGCQGVVVSSATPKLRNFTIQYQETYFDFMRRILQREGLNFCFIFNRATKADNLHIFEGSKQWGLPCPEAKVEIDERHDFGPMVDRHGGLVSAVHTSDINHGKWKGGNAYGAKVRSSLKNSLMSETDIYPGGMLDMSETTQKFAEGMLGGYQTGYNTSQIYYGRPDLEIGCKVTSSSMFWKGGTDSQGRNWVGGISDEFAIIGRDVFFDAMELDGNKSYAKYTLLSTQINIGPPPDRPRLRERGLIIGKVIDGPDKDPQSLGRFSVNIMPTAVEPLIVWAHAIRPFAGPEYGVQFDHVPDNEVALAFLHDDSDRPTIVGAVHNDFAKPPFEYKGSSGRTYGIRTPNKNELSFYDESNAQLVKIHAEHDMETTVKNDKTTTVEHDTTFTGEGLITLIGEADIKVDGKSHVDITGTQSIKLEVAGNSITIDTTGITIKGNIVKIEAQGQLEAKASGMATFESSAVTQVKGSIVKVN